LKCKPKTVQKRKKQINFSLCTLYYLMSNNANIGIEWLDAAELRQDTKKVSEEAIKRVQEQGKKAKQAQQDIKQDKDVNDKLAKFLSFLLKNIKQERLIQLLYNTFFKVKHPHSDIVYLRKTINSKIIVGVFVPFYPNQAKEYKITELYSAILPSEIKDIKTFVSYLKNLSIAYHDNIPVDKDLFLQFTTALASIYIPVYTEKTPLERKQLIQLDIAKYLYNK